LIKSIFIKKNKNITKWIFSLTVFMTILLFYIKISYIFAKIIKNEKRNIMKKIIYLLFCFFALASCKKELITINSSNDYTIFGDSISVDKAISNEDMLAQYNKLKPGDTLNIKFKSKIKKVCQKKGCWMTLELPSGREAFVKFKDYAFFVPKNAQNEEVIINGKAFVSIETVEELKHYAKDEGKSQAAIDSIVSPKTNYSFMADGVLIKK